MNIKEALRILDNAIEGNPNSCLSEHARKLAEVREYLATGPHVVAAAPSAPPPQKEAKTMSDAYCKTHYISYCPDLSNICPYCRREELEAINAELKATIKRVEDVRDDLATQTLNDHAVKMLDKALEKDDE